MASVEFRGLRQKKVWPRRSRWGGDATDCAGVGFGANRAGGFLPPEAAGGYKTVVSAYFRGRGACTRYGPKVILGAKTQYPEGDAYYTVIFVYLYIYVYIYIYIYTYVYIYT